MDYIDAIARYFNAWLAKNDSVLSEIFAPDVIYTECYGPQYQSLSQIQRWFADWNLRGTVLQWDIKNVLESGNTLCVEWYFTANMMALQMALTVSHGSSSMRLARS